MNNWRTGQDIGSKSSRMLESSAGLAWREGEPMSERGERTSAVAVLKLCLRALLGCGGLRGNPSSGCTELVKQEIGIGEAEVGRTCESESSKEGLCRGRAPEFWRGLPLEMKLCVHRVDRGGQWGTRRSWTDPEPEWGGLD